MIHDAIGSLLKRNLIENGSAPGAVAGVAWREAGQWRLALGCAGWLESERIRPVRVDSIYDLASLTKPCLASSVARLDERGALSLDAALASVLPLAQATASGGATLRQLLSHRAGLEAHILLAGEVGKRLTQQREVELALLHAANARREECSSAIPSAGFAPVYSDLGYILVGFALEHTLASELDAVMESLLSEACSGRLRSARQWGRGLGCLAFHERTATTEHVALRGGPILARVHDDNAWSLGGLSVCGHAGLFGTAPGMLELACHWLDACAGRGQWLSARSFSALTAPQPGGSLRCGFDGIAASGSSAGPAFGPASFGHLGFTGTSVWCDPGQDIAVVLLTNRVCPSADNIGIRQQRPGLHSSLLRLAG